MAKKKYLLEDVAKVLDVHPRTILRYATGDANAYWAEGFNPKMDLRVIGKGFESDPEYFEKIVLRTMRGKDKIMRPTEMSKFIDVALRTFRYRKYPALIHRGNIVRFSRYDTTNHHIENYKK